MPLTYTKNIVKDGRTVGGAWMYALVDDDGERIGNRFRGCEYGDAKMYVDWINGTIDRPHINDAREILLRRRKNPQS